MPPEGENQSIAGYRIEGTVTNNLGEPLPDVEVSVSYDYDYENDDPPPSQAVTLTGAGQLVTVAVYDARNSLVRVISSELSEPGSYLVRWDRLDSLGADVPAGLYEVRYIVGVDTPKVYDVLVDGTVTAKTDDLGKYVVGGEHLPVGAGPIPLYSDDGSVFYGNYIVRPDVFLTFASATSTLTFTISLEKDRITPGDVVLN